MTGVITHRDWVITWDYGYYSAIGPDYEAWPDGEDGWDDNGQCVTARTLEACKLEIDTWIEEHTEC